MHNDLDNINSSLESLIKVVENSPDRGMPPDELSRWRRFYAGVPQLIHYRDFAGAMTEFNPQGAQMVALYIKGIRDIILCTSGQVEEARDYLVGFTNYISGFLEGLDERQKQTEQDRAQRVQDILSDIRDSIV